MNATSIILKSEYSTVLLYLTETSIPDSQKAKIPDSRTVLIVHSIELFSHEVTGLDGLVFGRRISAAGLHNEILL